MKMPENGGFEGDHLAVTEGPGFSQLLFPADEVVNLAVDSDQTFNYTRSSTYSTQIKPPKMLCFGNYDQTHGNGVEVGFSETAKKSAAACSESSSVSSTSTASINALPKSNNKRQNGSAPISSTTTPTQRAAKKTKSGNPVSAGDGKVQPFNRKELQKVICITRKEKLGERITALQQLVSPYGKTDTASVLHEAMGYIRFLQEQVQVLCSPYLQRLPPLPVHGGEVKQEGRRSELRSRGLCLVPMEYTTHVGNSNGADFWSPAMANMYNVSSPSTKY